MVSCHFIFLTVENHTITVDKRAEGVDDVGAKHIAAQLLADQRLYTTIEMWSGDRLVGRHSKVS